MIIGSKLARAGSGGAEIPKKLLSLLMAAVLALSLAPSAAWAQPEAPAAAPTEKALTDAQTADELATSQTAQPVEEAPQLDELAPDPESADEGPEALEEPTDGEDVAAVPVDGASALAAETALRTAPASVDGVRIKASASSDLPSKIGIGQPLYAWAFVEEDDGWWDTEEVEIDDYDGAKFQWYRGATKVSYAYGASSYRDYAPVDGAVSQTYQAGEDDQGSYLAVKVMLPGGGEFWSKASTPQVTDGKVELASVEVEGKAKTGQTLVATAYGEPQYSWQDPEPVTAGVTYQWLRGAALDGEFVPLEGAAGSTYQIAPEDAGCYLKVAAVSSNTVEAVTGPVVAAGSPENEARLAAAVEALERDGFSGWCPNPVYGVDANLNDMMAAELEKLGSSDVTSTVSSAVFESPDPKQAGGVDTSSGPSNGDIAYFYVSPEEKGSLDYSVIRKLNLTFSLACGDASDTYVPGKPTMLAWDEGRVEGMLKGKASSLAIGFATGEGLDAVTQDLTLPNKLEGKPWSEVTWASSNPEAVKITGYAWEDRTGSITRSAADRTVTLTATVGIVTSGGPETTVEKTFEVTVKGDPDKVAAEKAALEQKVGENFTYESIKLAETGEPVGASALTGDVSLPKPAAIGVDGKYYEVKYTASTDAVVPNGWAGKVYRPLPGEDAAEVDITLTVTDKANAEISASKTLSLTVAPLEQADLDREAALMEQAVAGYAAALANGQDAGAVAGDLHAFQKAYLDADGNLAWAYDHEAADAAGNGIVPVDLEGYDPMGSAGWRLFKSSNPSVVSHENLLVTQPAYNAKVTVESRLASEKYARYAERYPDDAAFQKLAGRDVAATFTVKGTSGQEDPFVTATCSVIGADLDGAAQTWAAAEPYTLDAGATVADLAEALFAETGMTADFGIGAWGWSLNSITSPFDAGLTLEWGTFPDKGWMFYVNGQDLGEGADKCVLQPGDRVIWRYGAWDDPAPTDKLSVTCEVIGADADGAAQTWASAATFALDEGATAADLTEQVFAATGLKATIDRSYGWYLSDITSPFDDLTLAWNQATGNYWRLFVNGAPSNDFANECELQPGDAVVWYYTNDGSTSLPDLDDVVTDPDAPRPSYDADWPGFGGDGAVEAPTPTQSAEQAWSYDFREGADGDVGVSEPLIVNGDVYLVVNGELRVIDASTGTVKKNRDGRELRANVGGRSAYCNRPVYTEGVVIVPSDDGSLAAFTADELVCVWKTKPLEADGAQGYQSLSSLTVSGSYVFAAFTTVGAGSVGTGGVRLCVDVRDGSVRWLERDEPAEQGGAAGYYWAGAAVSGADLVVGNDAGLVQLVDGGTGRVKATVDVGAPIRAGVVALPGSSRTGAADRFVVVSSDGVLHLVAREGDQLAETGSARFAAKSTSTPAVSGGKAFVCGADDQWYGTLSVIDLASLAVERTVRGGKGEAQSSPLVSVQGDGTYAYFTCNGLPGGVYGYRLGDEAAYALFTPAADGQDFCFASVVADGAGNLYYTNDAGRLFALKGLEGVQVTFDVQGGSFVPSAFVALGKPVLQPADPVRSGYTFAGWFSDKACTTAWDFATPVDSALTLYAKWEGHPASREGRRRARPRRARRPAPARRSAVRRRPRMPRSCRRLPPRRRTRRPRPRSRPRRVRAARRRRRRCPRIAAPRAPRRPAARTHGPSAASPWASRAWRVPSHTRCWVVGGRTPRRRAGREGASHGRRQQAGRAHRPARPARGGRGRRAL